jgi:hypothetical protein
MNNDRRMQLTVDRWREENGYAPLEAPRYLQYEEKGTPPALAYRIGHVIGRVLAAATLLVLFALAGYGLWTVLA